MSLIVLLQILNDPRITESIHILRTLWGQAAGALEDSWAEKILASKDSDDGDWRPPLNQ